MFVHFAPCYLCLDMLSYNHRKGEGHKPGTSRGESRSESSETREPVAYLGEYLPPLPSR